MMKLVTYLAVLDSWRRDVPSIKGLIIEINKVWMEFKKLYKSRTKVKTLSLTQVNFLRHE